MHLNFEKGDGLIPVIIQDHQTLEVLMLGFMNEEALTKTQVEGKVTFFSRTKNRLWTKGEESGIFLYVREMYEDCDQDTLLVKVAVEGPVCHTGNRNCFKTAYNQNFIFQLENIVRHRIENPTPGSYVSQLKSKGLKRISQKVGEEAVETVIAALTETHFDFINESSDLLFHLLILLQEKNSNLLELALNLKKRDKTNIDQALENEN
jgi:phosphoribosyl-ATP pyrophosphohydrolase/phosphoribosyl-AMP cyclohydrolase